MNTTADEFKKLGEEKLKETVVAGVDQVKCYPNCGDATHESPPFNSDSGFGIPHNQPNYPQPLPQQPDSSEESKSKEDKSREHFGGLEAVDPGNSATSITTAVAIVLKLSLSLLIWSLLFFLSISSNRSQI